MTAFLTGALAASPSAEAQRRRRPAPAPAPAEDAATREARQHYDRGREQFTAGAYEEALGEFQAAFAAKSHPIVLLSIAETQERLDRPGEAAATLEQYLTVKPDAADRADVERRIATLRAKPARLSVTSSPEGADIRVDGEETAQRTPAEVELEAGEHELSFELEGYETASMRVDVQGGERRPVEMTLVEATAPETTEPVEEDDGGGGGASTAAWIFGGVAGAGLVAGTVFGFLALGDQAEFEESPSDAVADRGERMALFADIGFGVAVAAGVTALVLTATSGGGESDEGADEEASSVRVVPVANAQGGGLAFEGAF